MRFEPPVQWMPRFSREDLTFYGRKIRKNRLVVPVIASANRDAAANADPDTFDITRKRARHVAFGRGIHLCLGLARMEGRIAMTRLLERFPEISLAPQKSSGHPSTWCAGYRASRSTSSRRTSSR